MILLNYQVLLVAVAMACVAGLAGTEHQNIESCYKIIQVQIKLEFDSLF